MRDDALARARIVIAGLAAGPSTLVAIAVALGGEAGTERFAMPAALAGLVALPIGWRLHAALLDRARRRDAEAERISGFVVAIVAALAITGTTALLGIVAYVVSRQPLSLVGLAMHIMLVGLLWPSRDRLDAFLDEPDAATP